MPTTGLTLGNLIGPIAAATIINVILFALAWRGHQIERRGGRLPRPYEIGLFGYFGVAGLILYAVRQGPLSSGLELFGAALVSEGLGVVITYGLVHAFVVTRGRPWSERVAPMLFAVLLAGGMFAAVLTI